jgi:two-component system sensor histidine kinase YesM
MNNRLVDLSRFSIRHQVILLFFIVIMLPFMFIGYFAYHKSVEAIKSVSSIVSLDMMEKNTKNLDNYLNLVNTAQNELMYSAEMQNLLDIEPNNPLAEMEVANKLGQLTNMLSSNPHAYSIRVFPIDPSSYPTFTNSIYHGIDIENMPWFQQAKVMKSPFWQLFLPKDNPVLYPKPIISKIKQLYSLSKSQTLGFVAADVKVSTLGDYLAPVKMLDQQQVMLIDANNVINYHQDESLIGTRITSSDLIQLLKTSGFANSKTIEIDKSKYMVTYATLGNNDWKVVSMLPISVLTKPVSGLENISFIFLFFYSLLSVLTIVFLTVRYTNPILKLVKSMRRVELGDFSAGWPQMHRLDEIGWLYRGFDNMVRRVEGLVQNAEKAAKDKKELEFQVLTHQINPHFLYNTLESIRWKAENLQAYDISEMVRSLGNLFRLSLNDGRELTTVEREMEHVRSYVNIQNARSDSMIRVVYLIDDEIANLPCLRLLFQPLVENAIKHGMRFLGDGDSLKIVINGRMEQSMLRFEISDNGPGIPDSIRKTLLSSEPADLNQRRGVGLRNVHERLKIYFGEKYGLQIADCKGPGTVIEMLHPILTNEELVKEL